MNKIYILLYSLLFSFSSAFGGYTTDTLSCQLISGINTSYNGADSYPSAFYPDCLSFPSKTKDVNLNDTVYTVLAAQNSGGTCSYIITPQSPSELTVTSTITCLEGEIVNPDNTCECISPCSALSTNVLSLPEAQCYGTNVTLDYVTYSSLSYQACDTTCYGLEATAMTCNQIGTSALSSCDWTTSNFLFKCDDLNGTATVITNECKVKTNPCDTEYDNVSLSCDLDTQRVDGYAECTHNGMFVTNESIQCVEDTPLVLASTDCSNSWNEVLNSITNTCDCKSGYSRNTFGDCWKPLFSDDSNLSADQQATETKAQIENNQAKEKAIADSNATGIAQKLSVNTVDTLSGLRQDLNNTNDLLSSIKDKLSESEDTNITDTSDLDDLTTLLSESDTYFELWKSQFLTFSDNVDTQLANIDTQYTNARALFDTDATFTVPSGSTANCLTFDFRGKTITFDLCTSFSLLSPIVYFITTLLFMIATFRFMVNHLLGGLE